MACVCVNVYKYCVRELYIIIVLVKCRVKVAAYKLHIYVYKI